METLFVQGNVFIQGNANNSAHIRKNCGDSNGERRFQRDSTLLAWRTATKLVDSVWTGRKRLSVSCWMANLSFAVWNSRFNLWNSCCSSAITQTRTEWSFHWGFHKPEDFFSYFLLQVRNRRTAHTSTGQPKIDTWLQFRGKLYPISPRADAVNRKSLTINETRDSNNSHYYSFSVQEAYNKVKLVKGPYHAISPNKTSKHAKSSAIFISPFYNL